MMSLLSDVLLMSRLSEKRHKKFIPFKTYKQKSADSVIFVFGMGLLATGKLFNVGSSVPSVTIKQIIF